MKLLKKIKKNLFKSLLLLFVSIFIATCNSNIVFATTESPINFSNSYKNIVEPYEVEGGYSISDVEFVKFSNFQIYFLSSGWKSGVSFTGTYNVN